MSGKIESKHESQKSHLSSFTMKLMKFHSPKIKRTPSKKSKQLQPEPTVTTPEKPVNKKVSRLEEQEKEVVSALRYFKTIVDKMSVDTKVLQMLPGSASKVLEAILPLMQVEARIQHSSAVSSCHNCVYQSLANLIRWSDQVMLEGIDLDDKDTVTTVTTVIKAVLDGVKELVKLTIEKQEQPSPTSPNKPVPPVVKTESPPALPPKKRQSATSPTRVAVVAPMSRVPCGLNLPPGALRQQQEFDVDLLQRRFSGGSQSYGGDSPRLSPCNSMGKLSKSDEQLSSLERDSGQCSRNTSCETLEGYDPDYDFLHQDLSVSEPLPFPTGTGSSLSPLPECHGESQSLSPAQAPAHPRFSAPVTSQASLEYWTPPLTPGRTNSVLPPALPQKKRRSAPIISAYPLYERLPSHYDNLSEEEQPTPPFPLVMPASPLPQVNGGDDLSQCTDADSPPPLPEKKGKQILQYMQFVEDYSEPQPSVFYQMPQNESIYEQRRNKRFQEVYGFNDSYSSSDSVHEPVPPPALPPKQRQLDPTSCDDVLQDHTPHIPTSNSKEALSKDRPKEPSHGQIDDVDELSLIDHNDIMNRITLKAENDDGPDVRAGSGDILLVHATETDRKDLVLYCEAFLTTYRTFITPEDLIKKLHYRYTRFCHSPDTFRKRVSKNTFFVLVRVVDELCLVELTEDILRQLMDLVFRLVCNGELSLARVLRKNILDKVEQKRLLRHMHMLKPLAARGVSARPGTLHDFRSHEIADQLTLLDAELFYKIEIPEVLLWAKEQNEEKSPNLTQFTEHFNNMSYWVRSIIIQQEKAQDREKLLLKFIKIMKHLRKLNNFNSYLAILSALDSAPIRRLEWQKQTSEGLEEYCTLIDSSSSFRAYRAALAEVEPPCIPYLGLILQDLTFVHLGNPDFIDGKVNFSKRWQQFNILDSMRRFQQVHYELKRNEDIVSFFNDFSDHLAEEALWELSLKIKPRNISRRRTEREEKT
ncbi:rap guanine nucleotide exchange factor 1-like isoform X7 [Cyprinus carpio]|uniref:CRK SH3-binding GNRP n=1 Tax=Cyprinus carpio TaxID=7962 RepID=A0A9R0BGA1_CYPCA|nr:rap guanine nucleotide exchange factor 1-like isoform X7 [Cyprinus carpio]